MSNGRPVGVFLNGTESFRDGQTAFAFSVLDFWRWSSSNLLSNALRGVVAEFLVAQALGCTSRPRIEWDACDLVTAEGLRVEVKASGYVQSWAQAKESRPSFGVGLRRSWHAATNTYSAVPTRSADVYVFALHAHRERSTADPLDVSQWEFYVAAAEDLDRECPKQKQVGLALIRRLCGTPVPFGQLRGAVQRRIESRAESQDSPVTTK